MHGVIFSELQNYARARVAPEAWETLLTEAGLRGKTYLAFTEYPDEDMLLLVAAAARATGNEPGAILEDFGEFIAPSLLRRYRALVPPHWKTLDVLEHAESTIHTSVRLWNPGASPPRLDCRRTSVSEVQISYDSPRKLCRLATGLARGLAGHFHEQISIHESSCMLTGAPTCELSFKLAPVVSAAPQRLRRA